MTQERSDGEDCGNRWKVERDEATRCFYLAHCERLEGYVRRRMRGLKEEAEDVRQETWLSFYFKWDEYIANYPEPAMALFPIAHRRIVDFWRNRRRMQLVLVEGEDLEALADAICAESGVDQKADTRIDVERALEPLPSRQREALQLRYIDHLTFAEAAVLMGRSENAVKNLRRKALARLRRTTSLDLYGPEQESE